MRSIRRRRAHAIGFEGGLFGILVQVVACWPDISLWQAFLLGLALVVFFLVYSFGFAWFFDRVFGLADSVRPDSKAA